MNKWLQYVLIAIAGMAVFSIDLHAQTIVKKPGDPVIWNWSYLVADEPNASGFRLYSSTTQTGTFTYTGNQATPSSVRTMTVPAAFSSGSVVTWYTIRAFFSGTNPPATVESTDSNAVEVDRAVTTPTGLQGR